MATAMQREENECYNVEGPEEMKEMGGMEDDKHGKAYIAEFLSISPSDYVNFPLNGKNSTKNVISLFNTGKKDMTYKFRTNNPERYKVRPFNGIVKAGNKMDVTVGLNPEYRGQPDQEGVQDKFLIMAIELRSNKMTPDEINEMWKRTSKSRIVEHKLRCVFGSEPDAIQTGPTELSGPLNPKKKHQLAVDFNLAENVPDEGATAALSNREIYSLLKKFEIAVNGIIDLQQNQLVVFVLLGLIVGLIIIMLFVAFIF